MNKQDYFDRAVAYFRTMTHKSQDLGQRWCAYKAMDGNRCVVGFFIPEGHDAEHFKGDVDDLIRNYPDLRHIVAPLGEDGLALANALQIEHDMTSNWDEHGFIGWDQIAKVARLHDLEYLDERVEDTVVSKLEAVLV